MILVFIATWIFFWLLRVVFVVLGFVLIPIALMFNAYETRQSKVWSERTIVNWTWEFMHPWGNEEDGILAGEELIGYPNAIRIFYWSAIRNPANNLRFMPFFSHKINKDTVEYKSSFKFQDELQDELDKFHYVFMAEEGRFEKEFWYLAWDGLWRSNFRIEFKAFNKYWRFWFGNTKIYPSDKYKEVQPEDYRYYGAGPVSQFKRIKYEYRQ